MAIDNDCIICPYCGAEHNKHLLMGNSGLVNYCGSEKYMSCRKCGKSFDCKMEVIIRYKTRKVRST